MNKKTSINNEVVQENLKKQTYKRNEFKGVEKISKARSNLNQVSKQGSRTKNNSFDQEYKRNNNKSKYNSELNSKGTTKAVVGFVKKRFKRTPFIVGSSYQLRVLPARIFIKNKIQIANISRTFFGKGLYKKHIIRQTDFLGLRRYKKQRKYKYKSKMSRFLKYKQLKSKYQLKYKNKEFEKFKPKKQKHVKGKYKKIFSYNGIFVKKLKYENLKTIIYKRYRLARISLLYRLKGRKKFKKKLFKNKNVHRLKNQYTKYGRKIKSVISSRGKVKKRKIKSRKSRKLPKKKVKKSYLIKKGKKLGKRWMFDAKYGFIRKPYLLTRPFRKKKYSQIVKKPLWDLERKFNLKKKIKFITISGNKIYKLRRKKIKSYKKLIKRVNKSFVVYIKKKRSKYHFSIGKILYYGFPSVNHMLDWSDTHMVGSLVKPTTVGLKRIGPVSQNYLSNVAMTDKYTFLKNFNFIKKKRSHILKIKKIKIFSKSVRNLYLKHKQKLIKKLKTKIFYGQKLNKFLTINAHYKKKYKLNSTFMTYVSTVESYYNSRILTKIIKRKKLHNVYANLSYFFYYKRMRMDKLIFDKLEYSFKPHSQIYKPNMKHVLKILLYLLFRVYVKKTSKYMNMRKAMQLVYQIKKIAKSKEKYLYNNTSDMVKIKSVEDLYLERITHRVNNVEGYFNKKYILYNQKHFILKILINFILNFIRKSTIKRSIKKKFLRVIKKVIKFLYIPLLATSKILKMKQYFTKKNHIYFIMSQIMVYNLKQIIKSNFYVLNFFGMIEDNITADTVLRRIIQNMSIKYGQYFQLAQGVKTQLARSKNFFGFKIKFAGRLSPNIMAQQTIIQKGIIGTGRLNIYLDYAQGSVIFKYGKIGIKVWLARNLYAYLPYKYVYSYKYK